MNEIALLSAIQKDGGVVLVDVYKDDCGPCNLMKPTIHLLSKEYEGRAWIIEANIKTVTDFAARFNVVAFPTLLLFKNGELRETMTGRVPARKLRDLLNEALNA